MVKGISKQVIVVHSQDRKLFDQAIFILSDDAIKGNGVTNDMLLREANRLIGASEKCGSGKHNLYHALFLLIGAGLMGVIWLFTSIL